MSDPTRGTGIFLAFEGGDGAGKSTQVRLLAERLEAAGREVVVTRQPGGTALGQQLRDLVLHGAAMSPRAEALIFAADKAQHVSEVVAPALDRGAVVITDRYTDSSVAYQGAVRGLGTARVAELNEWATEGLVPDLTVLLDVDADTAGRRRASRQAGAGDAPDRMEQETAAAHETLRSAFRARAAAEPERYLVRDAGVAPEALTRTVVEHVLPRLGCP